MRKSVLCNTQTQMKFAVRVIIWREVSISISFFVCYNIQQCDPGHIHQNCYF